MTEHPRAGGSRTVLRRLLETDDLAILGGAHDALSARLVEESGFEGVWASSFGISLASRCLPDLDLLTMSETLDTVRSIRQAVDVPVVADCNAGWGSAINVARLVSEFEGVGVDGICIEDNEYPKRCSLYEDENRSLVSTATMSGKVRAAKATQKDERFVVIARCEALIADEGLGSALERASAYAEAGADAVLVHARDFEPLAEFVDTWDGAAPLVVVPTLFGHVTADELREAGFRIAIFPNHPVRAAITAMRETLGELRRTGRITSVEGSIATLADVEEIVRLDAITEAERTYVEPGAALQR
jgi:phosphoenolpyruvate phosphomutase